MLTAFSCCSIKSRVAKFPHQHGCGVDKIHGIGYSIREYSMLLPCFGRDTPETAQYVLSPELTAPREQGYS